MSKKLDHYDFTIGNVRYPWEQWADGGIWEITKGEDFLATPRSMQVTICKRARVWGMSARTNIVNAHTIVFQFYKPEEDQ